MRNTRVAFKWLVNFFRKREIAFEVFGGFDAKLFGAKRALADIDVLIADKNVYKIAKTLKKYIIFGPKRYHDHNWNILIITLHYKGQEIDICGLNSAKIFYAKRKKWVKLGLPIARAIRKEAYGKIIPTVSRQRLIRYKKEINRRVDRADVKAIGAKSLKSRISIF